MGILIGADLVPTSSNGKWFEQGKAEKLVGKELYKKMIQADYRIFNLEVPLTDTVNPIRKCGPNLIADTNTINGYKALKIDLLTLANNHILDQGIEGVVSTQQTLEKAGIHYVGLKSEGSPNNSFFFFNYQGKKVGVYACAEHEFSTLESYRITANPYVEKETCEKIQGLKKTCDFIIVLYHGGKEYYRYPSPKLQMNCRKMVHSGADLIICQHSHCIGCEEKYEEGTIIYGQGNFLFDLSDNECCQTGLMIELDPDFNISYIPLKKKENAISIASKSEGLKIIKEFKLRSMQIEEESFVDENYSKFAGEMLETYLWMLSGKENILFRVINKLTHGKLRTWRLQKKYNNEVLLKIYNCLICEAHNELLIKGLENKIYE